jgi:putative membrane protein (TIGR04086 family)
MRNEPRQTPTPPPPIEPAGFFTGVQIRPVITGVVVDYIVTYVAMAAFVFGYLAKELAKKGEVTEKLIAEYMVSPEGLTVALVIGSLCTALGGFIAARKANTLEIKHGAFVGAGSLIVAFIEQLMQEQPAPLPEWFRFVSIVVAIPAGALGGYVAGLLKGSAKSPWPPTPGNVNR